MADELDAYVGERARPALERQARAQADRPGVERRGDRATVTGEAGELADIPEMLRRRALDPDDWIVERAVVNEWQSAAMIAGSWVTTTLHQLKIHLRARAGAFTVVAARTDGPDYRPGKDAPTAGPELVVVLPDQQIRGAEEGYDPRLHDLVLAWLDVQKPTRMILSGDVTDMESVSRYGTTIGQMSALQQEVDRAYLVLRQYVQAAGSACAERVWIAGNHEARLEKFLRERAPQVAEVSRAGETRGVLSLPYLCRADELGFHYIGEYPHAVYIATPRLSVRHGWIARQKSGATAHATLDHLQASVIVGHTHRQSLVFQTKHRVGGEPVTLTAIEAGTLAQVRGGLGYAVAPDWQPGFVAVRVAPDGNFTASFACYEGGVLRWEAQRYYHRRGGVVREI